MGLVRDDHGRRPDPDRLGIFSGSIVAQVVAVFWAGFNAILHLLAIGAYPAWSIIIMAIDGLVIYAVIMYGRAFNEA
jgi:hypothetical protein